MIDDRVRRVYQAVMSLPRVDCETLKSGIPMNGVYFCFESGEAVALDGVQTDRIVRVGINTQQDNLPKRITHHFKDSGTSIFRWHVCCAMLNRENPNDPLLLTERPYSKIGIREKVSLLMRQNFTLSCVQVDCHCDRSRLEAGVIALLSQYSLGSPSPDWLGCHAVKTFRKKQKLDAPRVNVEIRNSGLWNQDHVNGTPISEDDLVLLEKLVTQTLRG